MSNPFASFKPWSADEDERLAAIYAERGYAAAAIAFPHRTHNAVRTRIHVLRVKGLRRASEAKAVPETELPRFDSRSFMESIHDRLSRRRARVAS